MAGNSFGKLFTITSFGESHGAGIGGIIDGCPAGVVIDETYIQSELNKRKPGQSDFTTPRKEGDEIRILSGVFQGMSTGAPIAFLIENTDAKSSDYDQLKDVFRPGHADFTWHAKFGIRDHRGGGRSSARETIARVVAGAVAKQILRRLGVEVRAYVSSVHKIMVPVDYSELDLTSTYTSEVRCPHAETEQRMKAAILKAKEEKDSLGGIVTAVATGVPAGWGEPVFEKLHATLGQAMLSINAVKGFEIGDGFSSTLRKGSENNDGKQTNHDGGIQGGISNGKDIVCKVGFKPTSTIGKPQQTQNVAGEEIILEASGRHDPCVLPRATVIVEAMMALTLVDAYLHSKLNRI